MFTLRPAPVYFPGLWVPLVLGASSIACLLLYFYGVIDLRRGVQSLLLPAVVALLLLLLWVKRTGRMAFYHRLVAGLCAGAVATFTYDLVRVPIAWSGIPVFKAISYFGTVIVGESHPTLLSEVVGWTYHLSNGVGFGLMYVVLVNTPRWWTATLWGLVLEGAMLLTPYAEVFGYRISPTFLAITIGAHVVYGLTLWGTLRYWLGVQICGDPLPHPLRRLTPACALVSLGITAIAADFHLQHAEAIPPSPPGYLGAHLYTTWNSLEPDRLAAMWVLQRFVDPQARFHFIAPFSHSAHGIPFDTPEAAIRRGGTQSVTEVLLAQRNLGHNERLQALARMTHLYEVTPWRRPADPSAHQLGQALLTAAGRCEPLNVSPCVTRALRYLDAWYRGASDP